MSDDVSSRLRLVTPPESEPVSLSEAKLFLRIEHDAEDAVINRAIATAREACEQFLRSALLPQEWELTVGCHGQLRVHLPLAPASAIDTITAVSVSGESTVLDETDFRLSLDGCSVFFEQPPTAEQMQIIYTASLADTAAALPALLKQGILHHVAALTEHRDGAAALPMASVPCYQPFRRIGL